MMISAGRFVQASGTWVKDRTHGVQFIDADKAIPWVEQRTKLVLADSQQEAIRVALTSKVLVITGGAGVGKTTLVNSILKILLAKTIAISLCAPTGRATKRLSESTGLEATMIHRLQETDPRTGSFRRNEEAPLDCDLLVVDEVSMVDVPLMRAMFRALPTPAALLLVGDADQLPSVGPGQVLADIIVSGAVPVVLLTEIFRQAAESRIVTNAHRINQGQMPDLARVEGGDFYFVNAADPEEGGAQAAGDLQGRIPKRFGHDGVDGPLTASVCQKLGCRRHQRREPSTSPPRSALYRVRTARAARSSSVPSASAATGICAGCWSMARCRYCAASEPRRTPGQGTQGCRLCARQQNGADRLGADDAAGGLQQPATRSPVP
jgi:AAA domain